MQTLERLQIELSADTKKLSSDLKKASRDIRSFESSVGNSVGNIGVSFKGLAKTIAALGIGKAIKASITDGMNAIESENRFKELFKGFSREVDLWSKNMQKELGVSAYKSKDVAAGFYELATAQGIAASTAKDMSMQLTQVGYDIASFKNKDTQQVFNALQSAFVGNTEALRSMGYVVTADMVKQKAYQAGLAATGSQLTQNQKAMSTYLLVMEQAGAAHGDLARTIASPANQLRILKDNLYNLRVELGKAFMPIVQVILPILNAFVLKLTQVVQTIGYFMQALFGKSIMGSGSSSITNEMNNYVSSIGGIGESYDDATQAAKKYKNATMGFDELNKLSTPEEDVSIPGGGGGDIGGGIEIPPIEGPDTGMLDEIPPKIQEIADKVKSILKGMQDFYNEHKEVILSVIGGIIAGFLAFQTLTFLSQIPAMIAAIGASLSVLATPIGIASIAIGALTSIFLYLWQTNEEFKNAMINIWGQIADLFVGFWENTLKPFGSFFINEFINPICEGFQTYMLPVFEEVFIGMGEILVSIIGLVLTCVDRILEGVKPILDGIQYIFVDCMRIVKEKWDQYGQGLVDTIVTFVNSVKETVVSIWDNIFQPFIVVAVEKLKELWDNHFSGLVEKFIDFVVKVGEGALKIWNEFLGPLVQFIAETFGPTIVSILSTVSDVFFTAIGAIMDILGGLLDALGGVIDFIVGIFTGDWERAWTGIKNIFGGIWDALVALVKYPIEQVWKLIKNLCEVVVNLVKGLAESVVEWWNWWTERLASLTDWICEKISNIWNTIWNFLKNTMDNIKNTISTVWNAIWDTIKNVMESIKNTIKSAWDAVWNTIKSVVDNIKNIITNVFNSILNTIKNIMNSIKNVVDTAWNGIKNVTSTVTNAISNVVSNAFNGIKNIMSNICNWISSGFKNAWSSAWNGIVNVFSSIWNGITNFVKAPLNFIIDMVNKVIKSLNKIKIPDWVEYEEDEFLWCPAA